MRTMRTVGIATLFLTGALVASPSQPAAAKPLAFDSALMGLIARLVTAADGVALGARMKDAAQRLPGGGLTMLDVHYVPLARTGFAEARDLNGTLAIDTTVDEDGPRAGLIDRLEVRVLPGRRYDRARVALAITEFATREGYSFEPDDEEDDVYWGRLELGAGRVRSLWIGLGETVIVAEVSESVSEQSGGDDEPAVDPFAAKFDERRAIDDAVSAGVFASIPAAWRSAKLSLTRKAGAYQPLVTGRKDDEDRPVPAGPDLLKALGRLYAHSERYGEVFETATYEFRKKGKKWTLRFHVKFTAR